MSVPVEALVPVEGGDAWRVRVTVASLLANRGHEILVRLVTAEPEGAQADLRWLREHFEQESRVRCVRDGEGLDPETVFVLRVRPGVDLAEDAVYGMVRVAERRKVALVRSVLPGDDLEGPRLERVVDGPKGVHWVDGERLLAPHARQEGAPIPPEEEMTEPSEGWQADLERTRRETDVLLARARRLERRHRWLTRTRTGRLVLGILR